MNFLIKINLDNAAFETNASDEIRRILHELAPYIEEAITGAFPLRDINGNSVGYAGLED